MRGNPIAGTPLLPIPYLVGAILVFLVLLGLIYLIVHLTSGHIHPKKEIKKFLISTFISILAVLSYAAYLLIPTPTVIATNPKDTDKEISITDPISINFSQPVSRRAMEKTITPDVPGVWVFEDPVYATHLYRKVVFYPDTSLDSGVEYTIKISNIENVIRQGTSSATQFSFKTKAAPPEATKELKKIQSGTTKLAVPVFLQQHSLSCEVSALKMTLAYKGINVSEEELLNQVGFDNTPHVGGTWGNPYEHFVGNVDGRQMHDGYGVYWGPIERVAKNYGNAQAFQNGNIEILTSNILAGNPIIIWTYSSSGAKTSWKTPSGVDVYAVAGEHTVVVVGFVGPPDNPTQIIVNDSLVGQVYWNRSHFNNKWAVFSQSGVIVFK